MIFSNHLLQRMRQRNISSFMIDLIMNIGDFNENCQRLIIDKHHKEKILAFYSNLRNEEKEQNNVLRELCYAMKYTTDTNEIKNLIKRRRAAKKNLKELNKKIRDLEKVFKKKYTLVLEDQTLITVF